MSQIFDPHAASHRAIEDRLGAIERDLAVIKTILEGMDKRIGQVHGDLDKRIGLVHAAIPSVWLIVGLILPLYGVVIFGMIGLFFALANLLTSLVHNLPAAPVS